MSTSAATPPRAQEQALLTGRGITLAYGGHTVLQGLDLTVRTGEIVALLGPSGVGKSSLLRVLSGLQAPTQGEVSFLGQPVRGVHPALAMAFQEAILLPWLNVQANTGFGLGFARQPRLQAAERRARVEQALRQVGLYDSRHLRPSALSGGMAQRVAIARCLARRPRVLLMDEPFGALDEVTRRQMQQLILSIRDQTGCAIVLVTHDIDEALLLADRALLLGGRPAGLRREWACPAHPRSHLDSWLQAIRLEVVACLEQSLAQAAPSSFLQGMPS